ncbi:DUF6230 family protein [Streptomyces sp. NBC_00053]|uniref:DUF6230 family protein n=1 Tax=unclassified Streptomyces TaxID=2593676 RepID=UPI000F5BD114|nr:MULTISPECIES: DUF6230 family protein [unclassified Streptomyces]WSG53444.1 DUF6230 family protein [Streptomyces sp. NBC_01732]WSW05268.1 DUF6230 family protein [Streptomyces sp. NBC_01005]WSX04097.1 DUF6230 family protein [Streptomyces sp. NBC_00987]WTC94770.1 DUF6230 family protein [Streptomyces sp. NBC_01650]MCX4393843.1 DUF6230 family protein [Streptomyces sp. NBC_01767]
MSSQVRGGTRWKRFALVMVPSVVATAAVGVGLAQGALAASFSVSGQSFKVRADKLVGHDFVQYGSVATGMDPEGKNGAHAVAVSGFSDATITNMCQSVVTPNLPFGLGSVTLQLKAGTDPEKPVEATNLYLDVAELDADAYFEHIDIGVAAGAMGKPGIQAGTEKAVNPNGFAQRAKTATLTNVKQTAWATTAGTFKLSNLSLRLHSGVKECY